MALTRTSNQINMFGQLLKTAAGRQKLAAALGPSLRRRRDYLSIARKALMVETLPDGALPIYDKEFDETGRSFIESYVVGEEGGDVIVRRNPKRVMVPTFEIASNPMIPITQIKERRFDIVARALNLSKATIGETEDKYIFKLLDVIATKNTAGGALLTDPVKNPDINIGASTAITVANLATGFGQVQRHDLPVAWIFMNPVDYVDILKWTDANVDRETQRKMLKTGVVGYIWGATILQSRLVRQGTFYILAENEFLGVMPERIPLTVMSADAPQLRQIGFSVFEVLGVLIFNPSGVQRMNKA
jgi:hypothetical protein